MKNNRAGLTRVQVASVCPLASQEPARGLCRSLKLRSEPAAPRSLQGLAPSAAAPTSSPNPSPGHLLLLPQCLAEPPLIPQTVSGVVTHGCFSPLLHAGITWGALEKTKNHPVPSPTLPSEFQPLGGAPDGQAPRLAALHPLCFTGAVFSRTEGMTLPHQKDTGTSLRHWLNCQSGIEPAMAPRYTCVRVVYKPPGDSGVRPGLRISSSNLEAPCVTTVGSGSALRAVTSPAPNPTLGVY